MLLLSLGPLHLSHEDLWHLTIGEIKELIEAYRYNEFLESQKRAQLASWILCGLCSKPPKVDDLVGIWCPEKMQPLSAKQIYNLQKEKLRNRRKMKV